MYSEVPRHLEHNFVLEFLSYQQHLGFGDKYPRSTLINQPSYTITDTPMQLRFYCDQSTIHTRHERRQCG
jgi:hypothetical protein